MSSDSMLERIKSIAVLPFVNIGPVENEYFADGITEEIINALTRVGGLKVTARTSSFYYKHKNIDARIIGNELGVETLLEGSIRIFNDRVRITTQLVRTDTGFHLWSENFNRQLSDIFALQDEISLNIAERIREHYGHLDIQDHLIETPASNVEAYKQYLKGLQLRMRWNAADVASAITYFTQCIELDPSFSRAYFEKGWCIGMLSSWGYREKEKGLGEAYNHINKGLELDPNSSLGYYAKGTISFWGYWNYRDSYTFLRKSLEINPNAAEVRDALADFFAALGQIDRALEQNQKALVLNPLSANLHFTRGNLLYFKRDYKNALFHIEKALRLDPGFPIALEMKAAALIWDGQQEQFAIYSGNTRGLERPKICQFLYDAIHHTTVFNITEEELREELDTASTRSLRAWELYLEIYRGNQPKALQMLEEQLRQRSGQLFNFKNDPFLDPLRESDLYKKLEASVFEASAMPVFEGSAPPVDPPCPLSGEEQEEYAAAVTKAMGEELYLDPGLSLKKMAATVALHPNKLSWLLNNHFGKNFNDFVNTYRVQKFQQLALMPENKQITLLGLAYDSGFNSKTVFNTFFKRDTGMTPKQWVKTHS